MQAISHQLHSIELPLLHPHPLHPRHIPPATLKKIRTHIQNTHFYEPLLTRPHPSIPNHFQIIHGHHRLLALTALHHPHALCLIAPLSDPQTLTLLATLNSLTGKDLPTKRLQLLQSLAQQISPTPLSPQSSSLSPLLSLLPESPRTLHALLTQKHHPQPTPPPPKESLPEAFTLFLTSHQKHHLLQSLKKIHPHKPTALLTLLKHSQHPPNHPPTIKPAVSDGAGPTTTPPPTPATPPNFPF